METTAIIFFIGIAVYFGWFICRIYKRNENALNDVKGIEVIDEEIL